MTASVHGTYHFRGDLEARSWGAYKLQEPAYISCDAGMRATVTNKEYTTLADYPDHDAFDIISLPLSGELPLVSKAYTQSGNHYWQGAGVQQEGLRPQAAWDWRTGKILRSGDEQSLALAQPWEDIKDEDSTKSRRKPRRRHPQWSSTLILATSLRALAGKNPGCVLYARKIQKLGLDSADTLRNHFEMYGPVDEVLLSNAHSQPADAGQRVRVRASGIALIVMNNAADVTAILQLGETHVVKGVPIVLRLFEDRSAEYDNDVLAECDKEERAVSDAGSTTFPGSEGLLEDARHDDSES